MLPMQGPRSDPCQGTRSHISCMTTRRKKTDPVSPPLCQQFRARMTALTKLLDHVPEASLDVPLCSSQRDTSPLVSTGFPPAPPEPSLETQQIPPSPSSSARRVQCPLRFLPVARAGTPEHMQNPHPPSAGLFSAAEGGSPVHTQPSQNHRF